MKRCFWNQCGYREGLSLNREINVGEEKSFRGVEKNVAELIENKNNKWVWIGETGKGDRVGGKVKTWNER